MRSLLAIGISLATLSSAAFAQEPAKFDAVLKAHAELPAQSFIIPPADAPAYFNKSGRFLSGARLEGVYSFADKASGLGSPFAGQPLQGFSGIRSLGDDRFLVLTDNGFGAKANSADAMLFFNVFKIDWKTGRLVVKRRRFSPIRTSSSPSPSSPKPPIPVTSRALISTSSRSSPSATISGSATSSVRGCWKSTPRASSSAC
jgi:hypothetical protein